MTSMPPPRQPDPAPPSPLATAHSLSILTEYTHTLDHLPLSLSRNFADLRELDAVLSSSLGSVTSKITQLTDMLETQAASPAARLWLLADIAEEVGRLKPGADDKIRVACHAADALGGHRAHMAGMLAAAPDGEFARAADRAARATRYPWVSERLFGVAAHPGEGARSRQRKALAAGGEPASPHKRKRAAADCEDDGGQRSPRKERAGDGGRVRGGARRRAERVASPAESLASVASQMPPPQTNARPSHSSRTASGPGINKRARAQVAAVAEDPADPPEFLPPPAAHPSLPLPFSSTSNVRSASGTRSIVSDWPAGQLEGPGMPVARSFPGTPLLADDAENSSVAAPIEGELDGDDLTPYCFCHRASFGQMIACDGAGCAVEWYHLECVGLKSPPAGQWICEDCQKKANAKRGGRGSRRRAGGGRSAARHTSG